MIEEPFGAHKERDEVLPLQRYCDAVQRDLDQGGRLKRRQLQEMAEAAIAIEKEIEEQRQEELQTELEEVMQKIREVQDAVRQAEGGAEEGENGEQNPEQGEKIEQNEELQDLMKEREAELQEDLQDLMKRIKETKKTKEEAIEVELEDS